jgi:acyl-CoA reductase-like NAD-dependent aldehyde dehydrogenase
MRIAERWDEIKSRTVTDFSLSLVLSALTGGQCDGRPQTLEVPAPTDPGRPLTEDEVEEATARVLAALPLSPPEEQRRIIEEAHERISRREEELRQGDVNDRLAADVQFCRARVEQLRRRTERFGEPASEGLAHLDGYGEWLSSQEAE